MLLLLANQPAAVVATGVAIDLRVVVLDLLQEFGRDVTLRRTVPGTYAATTGATAAGTTTDYPARARVGDYRDGAIDGTLVKQGDRRVTIVLDDDTIIPDVNDLIINGDLQYSVVRIQAREAAGITIVHSLQVRGVGVDLA